MQEPVIERNPAHNVEYLKDEVNTKLRELIDTLTDDQWSLFAEEDEWIAVLDSLTSAHEELKGEHNLDLERSETLKQNEKEIVIQITTKRTEIETDKTELNGKITQIEEAIAQLKVEI